MPGFLSLLPIDEEHEGILSFRMSVEHVAYLLYSWCVSVGVLCQQRYPAGIEGEKEGEGRKLDCHVILIFLCNREPNMQFFYFSADLNLG